MKRFLWILSLLLVLLTTGFFVFVNASSGYDYPRESTLSRVDSLIEQSFQVRQLKLPEAYDGPAVATLLSRRADSATRRAVLYLHGYGDYFFQEHLADWYNQAGYDFYALELRRYGRSWLPHQRPNYVYALSEYFEEIDRAVEVMLAEGHDTLLLNGHSTGGLTASLYCREGRLQEEIDGLFLNSPFLDFNAGFWMEKVIGGFALLGSVQPQGVISGKTPSEYTKSLHEDYYGQWNFNTSWKPLISFPLYLGWLHAVAEGHQQVAGGLDIACPVLVMHSSESYFGEAYSEEMLRADAVLDVQDIHDRSALLGDAVRCVSIPGAVHDIFLSQPAAVNQAFRELQKWMVDQELLQ